MSSIAEEQFVPYIVCLSAHVYCALRVLLPFNNPGPKPKLSNKLKSWNSAAALETMADLNGKAIVEMQHQNQAKVHFGNLNNFF